MKLKQIITTGIYTAIYFVFVCLGTLLAVLVEHNANMKYAPAFIGLLAGSVYLLLIAKTQRFGSIFMMSAIMSVFFFLSGHFVLSLVPSLLCGFMADVIAAIGHYRHKAMNLLSYITFSFGNLAPIVLMWVMRQAYVARLLARGKSQAYVDRVMIDFTFGNVAWLALTIVIGALIGGLFGQYLLDKYIKKAEGLS